MLLLIHLSIIIDTTSDQILFRKKNSNGGIQNSSLQVTLKWVVLLSGTASAWKKMDFSKRKKHIIFVFGFKYIQHGKLVYLGMT